MEKYQKQLLEKMKENEGKTIYFWPRTAGKSWLRKEYEKLLNKTNAP